MKWIKVSDELPPLDKIVWIIYLSDYNGSQVIEMGGRGDYGSEGWMWGVLDTAYFVRDWEPKLYGIIADDDYHVTHWAEIEWPED